MVNTRGRRYSKPLPSPPSSPPLDGGDPPTHLVNGDDGDAALAPSLLDNQSINTPEGDDYSCDGATSKPIDGVVDHIAAAMQAMVEAEDSDDDIPVDLSFPLDGETSYGAKSLIDAAQTPSPVKSAITNVVITESATNEATAWLSGTCLKSDNSAGGLIVDSAVTISEVGKQSALTEDEKEQFCVGKQSALTEEEKEQFGSIQFLYRDFRGVSDLPDSPWPLWNELSPDIMRLLFDTSQEAFTATPVMSSQLLQRAKSFNEDWLPHAMLTIHSYVTKIALSPTSKISRRNLIEERNATRSKSYSFDLKYVERAEDLYYITNVVGDGNCGIYSIKHGGDELASQSDTWRFPDSVGNFKIRWKDALRFRRELHDFIMSIETQFYSTDTCPIFGWQGKCDSVALYYGKRGGKMHSYLKDFLKKLWDPRYFRQLIGRHIGDLSRWLNTTNHIPLFALFLKCTIFVYSKEKTPRKPGHYSDQTFIAFYRHDNKVQVGMFWKKAW